MRTRESREKPRSARGTELDVAGGMRTLMTCAVLGAACVGTLPEDPGDESEGYLFEGAEVAPISAELGSGRAFVRLGVTYEAGGAIEVRTYDGVAWSDWLVPELVSEEEGERLSMIDAPSQAIRFQYRVPEDALPPAYVGFELVEEVEVHDGEPPTIEQLGELDLDVEPTPGVIQSEVTSPIGSVRIHSRTEWGARAPRCVAFHSPTRATIHHTVTPTNDSMSVPARLRQIQSFHQNVRGWCDIGYQFLVSRDGRIWRGRGARHLGAHVANANTGNVGISFIGTHTSTRPTATQECQVAKLLAWLHREWPAVSLSRTDVKGHRQFGGTSCPGTALYNRIDEIVAKSRRGCN
jgi:hypothetical protein